MAYIADVNAFNFKAMSSVKLINIMQLIKLMNAVQVKPTYCSRITNDHDSIPLFFHLINFTRRIMKCIPNFDI